MLGPGTDQPLSAPTVALGHVHAVSGSQATVGLLTAALTGADRTTVTVGKFVKIETRKAALVGVVTEAAIQYASDHAARGYGAVAHVDLVGEIDQRDGEARFRRGVTDYPTIGDIVLSLANAELRIIFGGSGAVTINIGCLQQASSVAVSIEIDEMLSKHFAVLGSIGVGKSSVVAQILLETMRARPELRIFLLDAHNEYERCFGDRAHVVNPANLRLPFWLFNFEEIVDVIFGGGDETSSAGLVPDSLGADVMGSGGRDLRRTPDFCSFCNRFDRGARA